MLNAVEVLVHRVLCDELADGTWTDQGDLDHGLGSPVKARHVGKLQTIAVRISVPVYRTDDNEYVRADTGMVERGLSMREAVELICRRAYGEAGHDAARDAMREMSSAVSGFAG